MKEISYAMDQAIIRVSRSRYFFYLVLSLLFVVVGYLLQNPVGFRLVITGMLIFLLLAVIVGSVRKGIIAILIFLPFMAFLRRTLYLVSPYAKYDSIHLVTPALVVFIFVGILMFDKERLSQAIRGNSLAKYVIALLGLFILQIFNPLQGSLMVGLGGALFYLIPMLWFFFGLHFGDKRLVYQVFVAVVTIGVAVSIYGLCQMAFGFLPFERYWIEHGGFVSLHVGRFIRPFSTFSSAEEYSRYIQIAGVIAFGCFIRRKNVIWLLAAIFIGFAVVMTGVRSSMFGLVFSILVLLIISRAKNLRRAFIRLVLLAGTFAVIMSFAPLPYREDVYQSQSIFYTMAGHTARGFINPAGEKTFQGRLNRWKRLFMDIVPRNPVGYGLGSTSIAAQKFGSSGILTESYAFSIFVNSGIIGGLLFLVVILVAVKVATERSFQAKDNKALYTVVLAITAGLFSTNIFGNSFVLYSVAPIGWFLIGYIAKQRDSQNKAQHDE